MPKASEAEAALELLARRWGWAGDVQQTYTPTASAWPEDLIEELLEERLFDRLVGRCGCEED